MFLKKKNKIFLKKKNKTFLKKKNKIFPKKKNKTFLDNSNLIINKIKITYIYNFKYIYRGILNII